MSRKKPRKPISVWGTVKKNGKGKRVPANWNGITVFDRQAYPEEDHGGISVCSWPEIWTFKPDDADWEAKAIADTKAANPHLFGDDNSI